MELYSDHLEANMCYW